MNHSVLRQIADLNSLSHAELQERWRTLNGKEPPAFNRPYLIKRLAYRIQEIAFGGLSEEAQQTMDGILDAHGFDENGAKRSSRQSERRRKQGVPVIGTRLVREWNGRTYEVTVVHGGFDYQGRIYRSLTAITKAITGTHWNGRAFFGLKASATK